MAENARGGGITITFLFAVLVAALGSGFQYGFNAAALNGAQEPISNWIRSTFYSDQSDEDAKPLVTTIYAVIVAIFSVGGLIGAFLTHTFLSLFGLKWGIVANNVFAYVAAALMGFAKMALSDYMLIGGRLIIGINAGLGASLTPMYLTEISPISARGAIGSSYQLFLTISILMGQIVGLPYILGNDDWPYLFAIVAVAATFQVVFFPLCADSPSNLYANRKKVEARNALVKLRGTQDVDAELRSIAQTQAEQDAEGKVGFSDLFKKPQLRKPLIISVMIMIAQQFSGINAIIYYSTSTFQAAKLSREASLYGTIAIGVVNVLMTIVSVFMVDRVGRKVLLVFSFATMSVDTLLFFICYLLAVQMEITIFSYLSILFVVLFVIFFAAGAGSIPFFVISELFARNALPQAVTIVIAVHWVSNFLVGLLFPIIQEAIGPYVFLIFVVLQVVFLIYIIVFVPETKGKTIEEVTAQFKE